MSQSGLTSNILENGIVFCYSDPTSENVWTEKLQQRAEYCITKLANALIFQSRNAANDFLNRKDDIIAKIRELYTTHSNSHIVIYHNLIYFHDKTMKHGRVLF
jgi:hypothetical protein